MLRIGLTGPAAAGKSTVSAVLEEMGFPVLEADRVAHELYVAGSELVSRIAAEFGEDVLDAEGGIDRAALGRKVFADPGARERINAIVHPVVRRELIRRLDALAGSGCPAAVVEAALLLDLPAPRLVDVVIGVDADDAVRRERLRARGLDREEAERRLHAQVDAETLRRESRYLIVNNGTLDELRAEARKVGESLRRRAGM